jgi:hypothetical protein
MTSDNSRPAIVALAPSTNARLRLSVSRSGDRATYQSPPRMCGNVQTTSGIAPTLPFDDHGCLFADIEANELSGSTVESEWKGKSE